MLSEDEREPIRRAYFIDHLKVSQIATDAGYCRQTIQNVIEAIPRKSYQLRDGRPGPRFQPFQHHLEELLAENETLPPKSGKFQVFEDEKMTGALLDRLTHRASILEFVGESYRFRQRLLQEEAVHEEGKTEAR